MSKINKDKQLERMKRDLQRHIDGRKWQRLFTATTIPFSRPKGGLVAVKVIEKSRMETMRIVNVDQELN